MSKEHNYHVTAQGDTLHIIHSNGLDAKAPNVFHDKGIITAPADYAEKRPIKPDTDSVVVCRNPNNPSIKLRLDDKSPYMCTVTGELTKSRALTSLNLNSGSGLTIAEIRKWARTNKRYFTDYVEAEKAFGAVSVKLNVELSDAKDARTGNNSQARKLESDWKPLSFVIEAPLYEAQPNERFLVEVEPEFTSNGATLYLRSDDLLELLETKPAEYMAPTIEKLAASGVPIITQ